MPDPSTTDEPDQTACACAVADRRQGPPMSDVIHPANVILIGHVLIVFVLSIRVIMKRPPTGVALSWVLLITIAPFAGAVLYLLIGERRIRRSRAERIEAFRASFQKIVEAGDRHGLTEIDWRGHPAAAPSLNHLGRTTVGLPTVRGGSYTLYSKTEEMLDLIARDIDGAESSLLMEFYIWSEGGQADEVLEAVIRAAERGVFCCLLIDALGARPWWKGQQPHKLRQAGVHLRPALPVGLFRTVVGRTDLRLHRKIVVIDGRVAWTGSMNLVDPRFFKQDAGVGEWVDAMVRLHGPVVIPLAATMIGDWTFETGKTLHEMVSQAKLKPVEPQGKTDIQVVPSGPGESGDALLQMILSLIYAAQTELVMTTPYFVPDESLLRAVRGAAGRGVAVRLVVPERVDSFLTRYASRSYFDDLLDFGVEIYLYRGGLLHTKSIMVDGTMAMFGTVNLDMRSLWLNYEVALFVYDNDFAEALRDLQQSYINDSDRLEAADWEHRPFKNRFVENMVRLVSPLL